MRYSLSISHMRYIACALYRICVNRTYEKCIDHGETYQILVRSIEQITITLHVKSSNHP